MRLENKRFVFKIATMSGYALKYTTDTTIIVAEYEERNPDFEFDLQSTSPSHISKKFNFCAQAIAI